MSLACVDTHCHVFQPHLRQSWMMRVERGCSLSQPACVSRLLLLWPQVGGELTDLLVVLRSRAAVSAFCGTVAAGVDLQIGT